MMRVVLNWLSASKHRLLLSMLLVVMVEGAVATGLFTSLEGAIYDSWFRLRGPIKPADRIVIVAIDEASIRQLGAPPWSRAQHGKLLARLSNAKVVGFDMIFDTPSNAQADDSLAQAISQHGRVVLATSFSFEDSDGRGEANQIFNTPINKLAKGAMLTGFANVPTEADGVVRRISLVDLNTFDRPYPSFSLAVSMADRGINPDQIDYQSSLLKLSESVIELDNLNQARPDFVGPGGTFNTYSYVDVLSGIYPLELFKDKIVLIGSTAETLRDNFSTPYTTSNMVINGRPMVPGVEVHATAIRSILEGIWYQPVVPMVNFLGLVLLGLTTPWLIGGRGPWTGLAAAFTMVFGISALAYLLWSYTNLCIALAAPVAFLGLNYTVMAASDFIRSELGRRQTRAMFSRYVSPQVVEEIMRNPDLVVLGGHRQRATVMFCDIRGFTAYSEHKNPEMVVKRLNEYLTAMAQVVLTNGGFLDKYLGDGLMAIFGAPVSYPDHPRRAIQAAVEIQYAVDNLNRYWSEVGLPPLNVGIGINSGAMLVGNVGSPQRMEYTAIGEEVNLASRMEGLTKEFATPIIICERTVKELGEGEQLPWSLSYLGTAQVKGFSHSVGIYTVRKD